MPESGRRKVGPGVVGVVAQDGVAGVVGDDGGDAHRRRSWIVLGSHLRAGEARASIWDKGSRSAGQGNDQASDGCVSL